MSEPTTEEILALEKEKARVLRAMQEEIAYAKQKRLYDICGKMHEIALGDSEHLEEYKEMVPDLFSRFSYGSIKKRIRKKPRLAKISFQRIDGPISRYEMLQQLACIQPQKSTSPKYSNIKDIPETVFLHSNTGQKWKVNTKKINDDVIEITYIDGSSSLLNQSDIDSYKIYFSPVEDKESLPE